MADVFVSYKAEDRRRVRPLVEALEADGYSVWWDAQIGGGAQWRGAIEAELNAAKCVIVAWSKRSVAPEGAFVQDEATRAQQRHVYVPVLIDKVHPPLGFGETQALPLTGWHGDSADARYQAVIAAVRRIAGEPASPSPAVTKHRVDRRALIVGGGAATAIAAGTGAWFLLRPGSAAGSDSIAVLPFENLSGDPAKAYFSDGIAEEIRSALSRIAGLTVIGRSSSEAVRNDDAPTAARKLGVGNILTGSVRQSPSTIRIAAELVDGRTGADRWSENYDRTPGDAIKIQTDIAESVASALSVQLLPAIRRTLAAGGTANPLAHDAYLKGIAAAAAGGEQALQRAVALFDAATSIDPHYADAFASKAEVLTIIARDASTDAATLAAWSDAFAAAQTAVRLAPDRSSSQSALGVVLQNHGDLEGATKAFDKALALGADVDTLRRIAVFRASTGGSGALALIERARERDPLNPLTEGDRGTVLYYTRHYPEAIAALTAYLRKQPDSSRHRSFLVFALILTQRLDEAEKELAKITVDWNRWTVEALLAARRGDRARGDRAIANLNGIHSNLLWYQYAQIHAQRGEIDKAIDDLKKAVSTNDAGLQTLPTDPFFDPLRSDPRFKALSAELRFPATS